MIVATRLIATWNRRLAIVHREIEGTVKKILAAVFAVMMLACSVHAQHSQVVNPIYPPSKSFNGLEIALSTAIANGGGTVDARQLIDIGPTSEIDVGNSNNVPVHLILPNVCNWVSTQKNPTAFVLRVYNKSSVISSGSGEGNACVISAGPGSDVSVVCGTDPANGLYVNIQGFSCGALSGSTAHNGVLVFGSLADESYVGHMTGTAVPGANTPRVLWIHSSCCSATFEDINADAMGASVVPCVFGNGDLDSSHAVRISNISCVHPGDGQSNLIDQENIGCNNKFQGIYMERAYSGSDLTTPYISVQAPGPVTCADVFEGVTANNDVPGSVRYVFDIASGAHVTIRDVKTSDVSLNVITDRNNGVNVTVPVVNSTLLNYTTEKQ